MTVIRDGEIELNGVKYPLMKDGKGNFTKVRPSLLNPFPARYNIGPNTPDNEMYYSKMLWNDWRGGMLCDELVTEGDKSKSWFTTLVDKYAGHLTNPRKTTAISNITAPVILNADMELDSNWINGLRSTLSVHSGTYSFQHNGTGSYAYQDLLVNIADYQGATVSITAWCYRQGTGVIGIDDGIGQTYATTSVTYAWEQITVTRKLATNATRLRFYFTGSGNYMWVDDVTSPIFVVGTPNLSVNFNGNLYWAFGRTLCKLSSDRTRFLYLKYFPSTITALVPSVNNKLYIFTGGAGTLTNGTGVATGTPKALAVGANTIAVTTLGTLNITLPAGCTGKAESSSCTVDSSPVTLSGNTTTTITTTTSTGNITVTITTNNGYWFMDTNETFTQTDKAGDKAFQWDDKLIKSSNGVCEYCAIPDVASPTWSAFGAITDITNQIENFINGPDAAGSIVPYCSTHTFLKVYDETNSKWISTKVHLADHPNGGKGACYWNSAIWLSYGLGIIKYDPLNGSRTEIGLNRYGGLPSAYNGEIVKLYGDYGEEMFILVDASQTTGTNKSGLYSLDIFGAVHCWWLDTANDGTMHDCIVSSASSAYAIYWDCGGYIYYIDLPRGITNVKQLAGVQNYADSGIHITPWLNLYDATAFKVVIETENPTASETVTIKYRINHAHTDIDTGWTTLTNATYASGAITVSGEHIFTFGTNAEGLAVRSIQFRFDTANGATETNTPDILSFKFYYGLNTTPVWGWGMSLDLTKEYNGNSPSQLFTKLKEALEEKVKVPFSFRSDETHYVMRLPQQDGGQTRTGEYHEGAYNIAVYEC